MNLEEEQKAGKYQTSDNRLHDSLPTSHKRAKSNHSSETKSVIGLNSAEIVVV